MDFHFDSSFANFFCLVIVINRKLQGRMQIQNCSLLMCQGAVKPLDEQLQQQMVLQHSRQVKSPRPQSAIYHGKHPLTRSVFSFKLNQSRTFSNSDRYKHLFPQDSDKSTPILTPIQICKSPQRPPFHLIQQNTLQNGKNRDFTSPFQLKTVVYAPLDQENKTKKHIRKIGNQNQEQYKQLIRITFGNSALFNQHFNNNNKNLTQTQNSSISSQTETIKKQQPMLKQPPIFKQPQQTCAFQAFRAERPQSQNSLSALKSDRSKKDQIVYPSFDNLQIIEHRKFFDNAKTIFTSNQLKDQSIEYSCKQLSQQGPNHQDSGLAELMEHRTNRIKVFPGMRKKTAYFGVINQDNQDTNQMSMNKLGYNLHQDHNHNDSENKKSTNALKKVHFQAGSHLTSSIIATNQDIHDRGSIFDVRAGKTERRKGEPSLHNIIQSKRIQHKISIQGSINEVSPSPAPDNEYRLKYENTIKSIGGQSLRSQCSFIDIKFMQNLNKRTPIVKLVE